MSRLHQPFHVVLFFLSLALPFGCSLFADGLGGTTVLIIRHADKPDEGAGLSPAGEARAKAYVQYFNPFKFHTESLKLDAIFAAADSKNSRRPRITVEPLAQALGLSVNTTYKDRDCLRLVSDLRAHNAAKNILICWHHGMMPELLQSLGADPNTLLPGGRWPGDEYNWLFVLRYDGNGHLIDAQRVVEDLTGSRPR